MKYHRYLLRDSTKFWWNSKKKFYLGEKPTKTTWKIQTFDYGDGCKCLGVHLGGKQVNMVPLPVSRTLLPG